jgi:hypothetical protein
MRACSASESREFSGTRLMPSFTQAKSSGTLCRPLFSSSATRVCGAAPAACSACASRLLSWSTSVKVSALSPKTMAVRGPCCSAPRRISSR